MGDADRRTTRPPTAAPQFSPDGKKLAYRAQKQAGLRGRQVGHLMVVDCRRRTATFKGKPRSVTAKLDRLGRTSSSGARQRRRSCSRPTTSGATPIFGHARRREGERLAKSVRGGDDRLACRVSARRQARSPSPQAAMNQPAEVVRRHGSTSDRPTPSNVSQANDELLAELDLPRPESVDGQGRGRHDDADVDPQAARLRREEEMAARLPRPRRAAGRVGGRLELPLEPAAVGGAGLRRRPAESARLAPASARSSSTRSAATGAASATTT